AVLSTIFSSLVAKIAAIAVAAAAATGGLAAANVLPASAQDTVSSALSHIGVHVPTSHGDSSTDGGTADNNSSDAGQHGQDVSGAAHATYDSGRDKGAAVSGVASTTGQEQRGANGPSGPTG